MKERESGLRWCARCEQHLSPKEFPPGKGSCTVCRRLRRYKLTRETYALLPGADGICPVCTRNMSEMGRGGHIDHDHSCCPGRISCGKCVRAVLCDHCNLATGRVQNLMERGLLQPILEYLLETRV